MADFITLSCSSCGHKLQITQDVDRFACAACGNEHIVNRSGGIVTLKPVIDGIKKVQVGVDKTASELAIARLDKEISKLEEDIRRIMSQESWISTLMSIRLVMAIFILFGALLFLEAPLKALGIMGLIMMISLIFLVVKTNVWGKNQQSERKKKAKPIMDELEAKKRELATHQEIVSKYK